MNIIKFVKAHVYFVKSCTGNKFCVVKPMLANRAVRVVGFLSVNWCLFSCTETNACAL